MPKKVLNIQGAINGTILVLQIIKIIYKYYSESAYIICDAFSHHVQFLIIISFNEIRIKPTQHPSHIKTKIGTLVPGTYLFLR